MSTQGKSVTNLESRKTTLNEHLSILKQCVKDNAFDWDSLGGAGTHFVAGTPSRDEVRQVITTLEKEHDVCDNAFHTCFTFLA